jgi:hypothetical protein
MKPIFRKALVTAALLVTGAIAGGAVVVYEIYPPVSISQIPDINNDGSKDLEVKTKFFPDLYYVATLKPGVYIPNDKYIKEKIANAIATPDTSAVTRTDTAAKSIDDHLPK